jgi:hypothetical protein
MRSLDLDALYEAALSALIEAAEKLRAIRLLQSQSPDSPNTLYSIELEAQNVRERAVRALRLPNGQIACRHCGKPCWPKGLYAHEISHQQERPRKSPQKRKRAHKIDNLFPNIAEVILASPEPLGPSQIANIMMDRGIDLQTGRKKSPRDAVSQCLYWAERYNRLGSAGIRTFKRGSKRLYTASPTTRVKVIRKDTEQEVQ